MGKKQGSACAKMDGKEQHVMRISRNAPGHQGSVEHTASVQKCQEAIDAPVRMDTQCRQTMTVKVSVSTRP